MISVLIRTTLIYIVVTFAIRIMGKRQIGDMQPNELVITLLISEIAAIPLQDSNQPILNGVAAICILVILEISVSVIAMKSLFVRSLINGESIIIIRNGKVDEKAMRRVRLTVTDLIELLREQSVFSIEDVQYGVLEVNGSLSILQKAEKRNLTPEDIKLSPSESEMPILVVCDGKMIKKSLELLSISEKALNEIIRNNNYYIKEIFLMTLTPSGKPYIVKKEK